MYETINQKIAVLAVFGRGHEEITPLAVRWNGRRIAITQLGYHHKLRQGRQVIHVFSVSDGSNFYELHFNAEDLAWRLMRVNDGSGVDGL